MPRVGKFESDSEFVIRIEERIPVPVRLSILIGDVAGSLRAALDHLAFALVRKFDPARASDPERRRWISFPVYESATVTDNKTGKEGPVSFGPLAGVISTVRARG